MPHQTKTIYLTFDDGPIPEVTPWVLDTLKKYNAKATFFCVGKNVAENSGIYERIQREGHAIGNHTMNHLNGWKTPSDIYIQDVADCSRLVKSILFRPPYGRISFSQSLALRKNYKLIFWDVLSKDYDVSLTGGQCFNLVKRKTKPGSIVVFHDSRKAEERLRIALPETLEYFSGLDYKFSAIQVSR